MGERNRIIADLKIVMTRHNKVKDGKLKDIENFDSKSRKKLEKVFQYLDENPFHMMLYLTRPFEGCLARLLKYERDIVNGEAVFDLSVEWILVKGISRKDFRNLVQSQYDIHRGHCADEFDLRKVDIRSFKYNSEYRFRDQEGRFMLHNCM